jgi:hypothetical protein
VSDAEKSTTWNRRARRVSPRLVCGLALTLTLLLGACSANGDFGRLKPGLASDDMHAWIGRDAAWGAGVPASHYPLTDEERTLRDLAYPLIEPPFDRHRWYALVNEYGVSHAFGWPAFEVSGYGDRLLAMHYRSATARYSQLNTDIRNDVVRIPDFFGKARRVLDLDHKRGQSLAYVSALQPHEQFDATTRVAENELVVGWVQRALIERSLAYCYSLQRLVIATPAPMAVEVERSLTLLNTRIAENRLLRGPQFGPEPVGCGPQVAVAPLPPVAVVSK